MGRYLHGVGRSVMAARYGWAAFFLLYSMSSQLSEQAGLCPLAFLTSCLTDLVLVMCLIVIVFGSCVLDLVISFRDVDASSYYYDS